MRAIYLERVSRGVALGKRMGRGTISFAQWLTLQHAR